MPSKMCLQMGCFPVNLIASRYVTDVLSLSIAVSFTFNTIRTCACDTFYTRLRFDSSFVNIYIDIYGRLILSYGRWWRWRWFRWWRWYGRCSCWRWTSHNPFGVVQRNWWLLFNMGDSLWRYCDGLRLSWSCLNRLYNIATIESTSWYYLKLTNFN